MYQLKTILLCLVLLAGSCATTQPRHVWTQRALDAETAQVEGRLSFAEDEYHTLLPDAPSADKRRWIQLNLATLAQQNGELDLARQRFRELANGSRDLWGANAALELAHLERPRDVDALADVVRTYPEEVAAEFALEEIVELLAAEDPSRLDQILMSLAAEPSVDDTEVEDNIWFAAAQNRNDNLRQPNDALDAYRALLARDYKGPLGDDALWEMAEIYREHQEWEPALTLLGKLADEVESSWFIGSYESDWVDNAIFDIGFIRLLWLDDYDGAEKWFRRFARRYPAGVLTDDAVWHLVQIQRFRGNDAKYRAGLRRFAQDFPESRWVRRIPPELLSPEGS